MNRAADSAPIGGNAVTQLPDSPRALEAMLEAIGRARTRVHFENYIIRNDTIGRRFAEALSERAAAGVPVRLLYDSLGCIGTRERYWRGLRKAGVEVRAFHPLISTRPLDLLSRNHRKLVVVDGHTAILGGLCIGDEWYGDAACNRQPWRDTMVEVRGPAVVSIEQTFARLWARTGAALPADALEGDVPEQGDVNVRVVDGVPGRTRIFRVAQLAYDTSVERIWIWDAYLIAPPPLMTALLDAARGGVDVRVMVPSNSDIRLVRDITRVGYRDLLRAGVRVFEWRGPMLHAKVFLVDQRWVRVGSSNLNASSLYANHELDVLIESRAVSEEMALQFARDMGHSTEIVMKPGRYLRRGRLHDAQEAVGETKRSARHQRSKFERGVATVVTLRRITGGLRRKFTATAAAIFALLGLLLVLFPRPTSLVLGAICFTLAGTIGLDALRVSGGDERRRVARAQEPEPVALPTAAAGETAD